MRCIVQRVSSASVTINGIVVGRINQGLLVLVGITHTDTRAEVEWMAEKLLALRVFSDASDKMNLSVRDVEGGLLFVSQFTLYGSIKKGTRPSFIDAAAPHVAEPLCNELVAITKDKAPNLTVETGVFGAMMDVELINDGPVTIVIERDAVQP